MKTGARTEIVSVQQKTTTANPDNNWPTETGWTNFAAEVWAHVEVRRSAELVENGQRYYESKVLFTFDSFDIEGIKPEMTILFGGVRHNIIYIRPDYQEKMVTVVECRAMEAVS